MDGQKGWLLGGRGERWIEIEKKEGVDCRKNKRGRRRQVAEEVERRENTLMD